MSGATVVILSNGSVFVEGIASRLRQHLKTSHVQTIDNRQADALNQVVAAHPTIIIAELSDMPPEPTCALHRLLSALPQVTLIRLDRQQEWLQVVTSEQRPAGGTTGLLQAIRTAQGERPPRRLRKPRPAKPEAPSRKEASINSD